MSAHESKGDEVAKRGTAAQQTAVTAPLTAGRRRETRSQEGGVATVALDADTGCGCHPDGVLAAAAGLSAKPSSSAFTGIGLGTPGPLCADVSVPALPAPAFPAAGLSGLTAAGHAIDTSLSSCMDAAATAAARSEGVLGTGFGTGADDIAMSLVRIAGNETIAQAVRMDLCRALTRAREQEQAAQERALELERLNRALVQETQERRHAECIAQTQSRALQRSLELLVQQPDIEGFFAVLAKTLVEECDSPACSVWLLDEAQTQCELWMVRTPEQLHTRNTPVCITDLAVPHEELGEHLFTYTPGWTQTIDYYGTDVRFAKAVRDFHRTRGVDHVTVAPLVIGPRNLGWIALATGRADECERPWRIALLEAMTRQATLALHQSKLAQRNSLEDRRKAILEERNRLARDIHDTLAQGFAAILMQLQAAHRQAGALPPAVVKSLETSIELARTHILEARRSVSALRPRLLEGRGLASALTQLTASAGRTSDVPIELILDDLPGLPEPVEDEVIRIAQEAVTNAARHARARRITVRASGAQGVGFRLSVADDGRGFDPSVACGFGMISMQERADRIGASLTIVTAPRHGAEVVLAWSPASLVATAGEELHARI